MHATKSLEEADRLMTVCNSCRYCEGLCAVFPAMEMRRAFGDGDLNYLANLCHECGACYTDCQFSPPHEFNVNVPKVLAQVRAESYEAYAWPRAFAGLFRRNGLAIAIIAALTIVLFILGFVVSHGASALSTVYLGPGAFYRLMPHNAMALLFGVVFLYAIGAIAMGVKTFWSSLKEPPAKLLDWKSLWQATKDALQLRYLEGGGVGCFNEDDKPGDHRRLFHHFTFYGFLLCFISTCVATLYHYVFDLEAPYSWYQLPVIFGALGGVGLVIGPIGLLQQKFRRDPDMVDQRQLGMGIAFLAMLFLTGFTGLSLLIFRETPTMGLLLAVHLGVVLALFLTMPYGKFVHGIYRFAALIRSAWESRHFVS